MNNFSPAESVSCETFHKILNENLNPYGVSIELAVCQKFFYFWNNLLVWNKSHNLTTVTDFSEAIYHHFLDSLFLSTEKHLFFKSSKVLDLGTGGGFPGIPLSLVFPFSDFYLLDKSRKKISFIEVSAANLSISNVRGINESFLFHNNKYNTIISRAVKIDDEIFSHCKKLLCAEGWLAVYYSSSQTPLIDSSMKYIKEYPFSESIRKIAFYQF